LPKFDAAAWDCQTEDDVAAGRLDAPTDEPIEICGREVAVIGEASRQSEVLGLSATGGDEFYEVVRRDPKHPFPHLRR
jgi:hypothetical protein